MKKLNFTLLFLLFTFSISATISWMGNHWKSTQPTNSQTIHFYVEMYDSYIGCHAEVVINVGGIWTSYTLSSTGINGNNSTWESDINVPSTATQYYFHGWDDWNVNVYDSNGGSNYTISINPTTKSGGDGLWSSGDNWCDEFVPISTASTYIIAENIAIDNNTVVGNIIINAGKQLTLDNTKTLTTTNFTIKSDESNGTGTFVDLNASGGLTINGTTKVEQYLASDRNWYISSPVTSAIRSAIDNTSNVYSFDETTGIWVTEANEANLSVLKGYIAQTISSSTVSFTGGTLNTGAIINNSLSSTEGNYRGFNLIGNPYPSYLNWELTSKTNLEESIWYRSINGTNYVFDTYNATSHIGTDNCGTAVNQYIAPMQAVWIRVNSGTTGTISLTNAMRSHQDQSILSNRLKIPTEVKQQVLRLNVSNAVCSDQTIIVFNKNASNEYDNYDSPKMSNNNSSIPEIYTYSGDIKLVINGLNNIGTYKEIPLGFKSGTSDTFKLTAKQISNFDSNLKVILKDNLLKTEVELNEGDEYNFTSEATTSTNRFSIIFKTVEITTETIEKTKNNSIYIVQNSENQIVINCNKFTNGKIRIFNVYGIEIMNTRINGTNQMINNSFAAGIYFITLDTDGKSVANKVLIK